MRNLKKINYVTRICNSCSNEFSVMRRLGHRDYCSVSCATKDRWLNPIFRERVSFFFKNNNPAKQEDVKLKIGRAQTLLFLKRTGGKYTLTNKRGDPAYVKWARSVRKRDAYTCGLKDINCNGRIEVHHILGWTKYKESRYDINNGITLCHFHHPRKKIDEELMVPILQKLISNH